MEGTISNANTSDINKIIELTNNYINNKEIKDKAIKECKEGKVRDALLKSGIADEQTLQIMQDIYNGKSKLLKRAQKNYLFDRAKKQFVNSFNQAMKSYRLNYLMTCFTENGPLDPTNPMWKQYCTDENGTISGFCLEYDLYDLLDQELIIDPIYYEKNVTLTSLCNTFNNHMECIFLHKNENGFDSKKDPKSKNLINWSEQREWRIVKNNDDINSIGRLYEKILKPTKAYYTDNMPDEKKFLSSLKQQIPDIKVEKIQISTNSKSN